MADEIEETTDTTNFKKPDFNEINTVQDIDDFIESIHQVNAFWLLRDFMVSELLCKQLEERNKGNAK